MRGEHLSELEVSLPFSLPWEGKGHSSAGVDMCSRKGHLSRGWPIELLESTRFRKWSLCVVTTDCSGTKRKVTQGQSSLLGLHQPLAPACSVILFQCSQMMKAEMFSRTSISRLPKTILIVLREPVWRTQEYISPHPCLFETNHRLEENCLKTGNQQGIRKKLLCHKR